MTDKPVFGPAPTASLGIPRFEITLPETVLRDFAGGLIENPSPQAEAALKALGIDVKGEKK